MSRPLFLRQGGLKASVQLHGNLKALFLSPPVISEKQKDRRKREKEEERKHVDINEHLMAHQDVAERYKTRISMEKPGESIGLTTQQAEQLLLEHGPNVLTPPKKRHWILKFWDCLSSLFNLLLILAGFLEYILLGIDFKNNFQNVSVTSMLSLANDLRSLVLLLIIYI